MHRSVPGLHRLLHLRRKIGASQAPFTPIAARPRNHTRYHRIVAEIRALEVGLIGHLGSVVHDLERRIRVRKAGEVVGSPSMKDEITNQRLLRIAQDHRCTVDDVNAALNHHPIEIDRTTYVRRLLALELVELDELAEAFRDKAIVDRDVASGALLTKIHERRATLLGLNAPQSAAVAIIDERPFAQTSTDKIEAAVNRIRGARLPAPEASDKPN